MVDSFFVVSYAKVAVVWALVGYVEVEFVFDPVYCSRTFYCHLFSFGVCAINRFGWELFGNLGQGFSLAWLVCHL